MPFNLERYEPIYRKALYKWGTLPQIEMMIEEASELLIELTKDLRTGISDEDVICSEIADTLIMLEQFSHIVGMEQVRDVWLQTLDSHRSTLTIRYARTNSVQIKLIAIETLSDLIMVIQKRKRGRVEGVHLENFIITAAHVCEYLELVYNVDKVRAAKLKKIQRLKSRIDSSDNNHVEV